VAGGWWQLLGSYIFSLQTYCFLFFKRRLRTQEKVVFTGCQNDFGTICMPVFLEKRAIEYFSTAPNESNMVILFPAKRIKSVMMGILTNEYVE
jgi:hypothetical protein